MPPFYNDLKDALHETLDANGVLNQLRARTRAEIFRVLEDEDQTPPTVSKENILINELIREYFEFNHYQYALSVFLSESNQPQPPVNRDILLREMGFSRDPSAKRIPLLYSLAFENKNSDSSKPQSPNPPLSNQPPAFTTANRPDEFDHHESQEIPKDDIFIDVRRKFTSSWHEDHVENNDYRSQVEGGSVHAVDYSESSSRSSNNEGFSQTDDRPQHETVTSEQNRYIEPQVRSSESVDQIFRSEAAEEEERTEDEPFRAKESHKDISERVESNLERSGTLSRTDRSVTSGSSISVHIEEEQEPDGYSDDFEGSSEEEKNSARI